MTAVNYEELRLLAAGLLAESETMTADIDTLVGEVQLLRDSWQGAAQEAFSLQFGYAQADYQGLRDWLGRASASVSVVRDLYVAADQSVVSSS